MTIDRACVSENVVGSDPWSPDAGPRTDPFEKLTNCPLQPMMWWVFLTLQLTQKQSSCLTFRQLWWCLLRGQVSGGLVGDAADDDLQLAADVEASAVQMGAWW
jgi:hypothetical protein